MSESKGLSLLDYANKQKSCVVCDIPEELRAQIRDASAKRIRRSTVLAWLKEEHGVEITAAELTSHTNGRHDTRSDS